MFTPGLFVFLSGILGSMFGWITGKVLYDISATDRFTKVWDASCGMAFAFGAHMLLSYNGINYGWLCWLAVIPATWLIRWLGDYLSNRMPEPQPQCTRHSDPKDDEELFCFLGTLGGAIACPLISAYLTDIYGISGIFCLTMFGVLLVGPLLAMGTFGLTILALSTIFQIILPCIAKLLTRIATYISGVLIGHSSGNNRQE